MVQDKKFDLIITIVNSGFSELALEAAKSAGAHGATIINARGAGIHEVEKFFDVTIQPEKEIIFTLVEREIRQDVMKSVCAGVGLNTEGR